jgi:succinylarginine dihydrolase
MLEYAFDGLVGPTHHYAGLSHGNVASMEHAGEPGNPRAAALQGLGKMRLVATLSGGLQGVLPPHERPYLPLLRKLGFSGSDADVIDKAYRTAPWTLSAASSASAMWAANAATVTPSTDSADGRAHFIPANLVSMIHRSLEAPTTARVLQRIFAEPTRFAVHDALPAHPAFSDEGAANHLRLVTERATMHVFGWGLSPGAPRLPQRYPGRQTRAASEAVARLNQLRPELGLFWQQDPDGIDSGAFHTDVLAVGWGSLLLLHERAFVDGARLLAALRARLGETLQVVVASEAELPLENAITAYPFNSQLVPRPDGSIVVLAPAESEADPAARSFFDRVVLEASQVSSVNYVDVNASMRNGGGPACLRLRVPLTTAERDAVRTNVFFDAALDRTLTAWVERHYRDRLTPEDLRDPNLLVESREALDELTVLLGLGSIYDFQKP